MRGPAKKSSGRNNANTHTSTHAHTHIKWNVEQGLAAWRTSAHATSDDSEVQLPAGVKIDVPK